MAENAAGKGKPSQSSDPILAIDQVTAPLDLEVTNITRNSVDLNWKKPESDGGAKITGYIVESIESNHGRWMRCNFSNVLQCAYSVTGLNEGEEYEFRVSAKNAAGSISQPSVSTDSVKCQDSFLPPRLDLDPNLKDTVFAKPGDDVKISAAIFGKPTPKIRWLLNGSELESTGTSRIVIHNDNVRTTLGIKNVTRTDSGKYILSLENCAGSR